MKVIFLDIDGVLNSDDYAKRYHRERLMDKGQHIWVDPDAVELVRDLCESCKVKIVLSSSWRSYSLDDTLRSLYNYRDLRPILKYVIGVTPRTDERIRGVEVEEVLDHWNSCVDRGLIHDGCRTKKIVQYAIVDDDYDMLPEQESHFVHIDWFIGITKDDIDKIKEALHI